MRVRKQYARAALYFALTVMVLPVMAMMSGCATDPETAQAIARFNAQQNLVPTLTLNCESGCRAEYRDPSKIQTMAMPTNGWDAARTVVQTLGGVVTSTAPYAALTAVGIAGVRSVQAPQANVTTTTTDRHDTVTTTTTTTSTDSTHTPTVVTQPAPLVVTQPAPIVVEVPAP